MVRPIPGLDWYDGAASGQQRSALMRLQPERIMISHATCRNTPWDNRFHSRDEYTLFVDSGGYHHMQTGSGEYTDSDEAYLEYIVEHSPKYWALRDYPCEPELLDQLDRSTEDHQQRTLEKHIRLLDLAETSNAPGRPLSIIQGWELDDYLEHIDVLQEHGCLTDYVGIGSVCRRHQTERIVRIILKIREELPDRVDLHAFGVKNSVLQYEEVVDALQSADSSAYDYSASNIGERIGDRFSFRDSLWSWLNWRRKLYEQVGSKSVDHEDSIQIEETKGPRIDSYELTIRDKVWSAALEVLRSAGQRFTLRDILEVAGLESSCKETVRKALHSMNSSGWVSHQPNSPYWFPGPKAQAELQA